MVEALEPNEFFEHMALLDMEVAEKLNVEHQKIADRLNAKRSQKVPYEVGDWVWQLKPKPVGGVKLSPPWMGPCQVKARVGESSYLIRDPYGKMTNVHVTELKPYVYDMPTRPFLRGGVGPFENVYPPLVQTLELPPSDPEEPPEGGYDEAESPDLD
jgi:hypothetical protein